MQLLPDKAHQQVRSPQTTPRRRPQYERGRHTALDRKQAWIETAKEVLDPNTHQHKEWILLETQKKIELRRRCKAVVNNSRTMAAKKQTGLVQRNPPRGAQRCQVR